MDIKLEEKLYNDFPQLFQQKDMSCQETCMCWGIECSSGWYDLIRDTCEKIMALNPPEDFSFDQVKEKWGGLNIYTNSSIDELDEIIDKAYLESFKICEFCGTRENVKLRKGGWMRVLCDSCQETRYEIKKG